MEEIKQVENEVQQQEEEVLTEVVQKIKTKSAKQLLHLEKMRKLKAEKAAGNKQLSIENDIEKKLRFKLEKEYELKLSQQLEEKLKPKKKTKIVKKLIEVEEEITDNESDISNRTCINSGFNW